MSTTSQNIDNTKKGYAAFAAGDLESALSVFDDGIEWVLPGNSAISGTYRGKSEVVELLTKLAEQSFRTSPGRFLADGDDVVVLGETAVGGESGAQADVYTYSDGKVVKAQSYGDTAMQERIFGTK